MKENTGRIKRRTFLNILLALGAGSLAGRCGIGEKSAKQKWRESAMEHPSIYFTGSNMDRLKSLVELKQAVTHGHPQKLWQTILAKTRSELGAPVLVPSSMFPGRAQSQAEVANPDYAICQATGERLLRGAMCYLLTEDAAFLELVMAQLEALFDEERWPEWRDQSHRSMGYPADLRTGMLSQDVALVYDWLYPVLTPEQRQFILEGLDRCGIQPYLASVKMNPFWVRDKNNWMTCIVGGLGIAGMALGKDHPQADYLVDFAVKKMTEYLEIYGPDGEFNESVAYANATFYPVAFFEAYRYYSGGTKNRLDAAPFPETCEWMSYLTVPPGHIVPFGDSHLEQVPFVKFFAPVASAARNPFLQWYYLQYAATSTDPRQLLWYDDSLAPTDPAEVWPLAKTYAGHGACFSSRTDWNQQETACAVYGKAGREENHEHNDAGQICIDGYGERLIVDLGSPSGYPKDFFTPNRWKYYNASVIGHDVIQVGGAEFLTTSDARGTFLQSETDNTCGAIWQMDLSAVYEKNASVRRTVVHLLPGIVVVVDDVSLAQPDLIQLRWHTEKACLPSPDGTFGFSKGKARLDGVVTGIGQKPFRLTAKKHAYQAPFDKDRIGYPLKQRHEPYLLMETESEKCRMLSLFAVQSAAGDSSGWMYLENAWEVDTEFGQVVIELSEKQVQVLNRDNGREWRVKL